LPPPSSPQKWLERTFEKFLWQTRFVVLLAVVFGLISTLILFVLASINVVSVIRMVFEHYIRNLQVTYFTELVMSKIIGAVDLYLIGVVLLIFSFGVYELFISAVDISETSENSGALRITSLNELKNKITKVIVMVLVVNFFQRVLVMEFTTARDMLFLAVSIFVLSLGLYFLHKNDEREQSGS
jgi:uncharacterized protein (TIGR00645 family)